ncbi:energy transducer TonB [Sphingomonas sp. JC676]|uniref:energy transducer TonB n=1 Tax=Sphingomonas sp. JC676 TaxID=2768065 RepID=UPI0016585F4E|nr:energy transducer TonB [Sphingomonas sp. JC676]MBC9032034.1 energy transducer TonB [Sphingomonas sp. JC676]
MKESVRAAFGLRPRPTFAKRIAGGIMLLQSFILAGLLQTAPTPLDDKAINTITEALARLPQQPANPPQPPAPEFTGERSRKPVPLTNPSTWATNDDYPVAALRAHEQGSVGFRLDIGIDGVPAHCEIAEHVSTVLDAATCAVMMARARFSPALDLKGKPAPASWRSRFRWELPEMPPTPAIAYDVVNRLLVDTHGNVLSCSAAPFPNAGDFCTVVGSTVPPVMATLWRDATSDVPATVFFRIGFNIEGVAPVVPAQVRSGMTLRSTIRIGFDLSPEGKLINCRETEHSGDLSIPNDYCTTLDEKYDVARLGTPQTRRGASWVQIYSGSSIPAERKKGE